MVDHVVGCAASGSQVSPARRWILVAEENDADDVVVLGYAEYLAERRDHFGLHTDEQCAKSLVDRLQQQISVAATVGEIMGFRPHDAEAESLFKVV